VVVKTGAIRRAKLQSNRHQQAECPPIDINTVTALNEISKHKRQKYNRESHQLSNKPAAE